MTYLKQTQQQLAFVFPNALTLPGSEFDEQAIHDNYMNLMADLEDESLSKAILCLFAWGYYGSNKTSRGGKGIIVKVKGENLDLTEKLDIKKETKDKNNPELLTASKLARVGVGYAYSHGGSERHKASPVWKKCPPWKTEPDRRFLQIHGHLIPLRIQGLSDQDKLACIAINATMHFASSKGDYRVSAMKRISSVCRLAGVGEGDVSKYISANINTSTIGGPMGEISVYLNTLLPKPVAENPQSESDQSKVIRDRIASDLKKLEEELAKSPKK
jgi:hypothetical protein